MPTMLHIVKFRYYLACNRGIGFAITCGCSQSINELWTFTIYYNILLYCYDEKMWIKLLMKSNISPVYSVVYKFSNIFKIFLCVMNDACDVSYKMGLRDKRVWKLHFIHIWIDNLRVLCAIDICVSHLHTCRLIKLSTQRIYILKYL